MKPCFQTKLLLHLLQHHQDNGSTPLVLLLVLGALGLLVMVAAPLLLQQPGCACSKQSEGRQYIGSMNRAQQAFYLEKQTFTTSIADLGLGIKTQTDNYVYGIQVHSGTAVTNKGASLKGVLKSYVGGTVVYPIANSTESTAIAVLCESQRSSAHTSIAELPNVQVNAKGEPTCPAGYVDLSKR